MKLVYIRRFRVLLGFYVNLNIAFSGDCWIHIVAGMESLFEGSFELEFFVLGMIVGQIA